MAAIILQIIVGILGLAKAYSDFYNSASAQASRRAKEVQDGRKDIADGNVNAVSERIDRVPDPTPGDSPRLGDDQDTERRFEAITGFPRVGVVGPGDGQTLGSGGSV